MLIRPETVSDEASVDALLRVAFDGAGEARLVKALRVGRAAVVALVAEDNGRTLGAIYASPMTLTPANPSLRLYALAPVAVVPSAQRRGVGTALVRGALRALIELRADAVLVLGDPGWYQRFGFEPAARLGLRTSYAVPADYFMALELRAGCCRGTSAIANYHPAFTSLATA